MLRPNVGVHDHTLYPADRILARVHTQRNGRQRRLAQAGDALGVSLAVIVPSSIYSGKYLQLLLEYKRRVRGRDENPPNLVVHLHIRRLVLDVVCILQRLAPIM